MQRNNEVRPGVFKEITRSDLGCYTIRRKLLKLGARAEVKKTLIRLHLPQACPMQDVMIRAMRMLDTG